ncbi:hypothetical protein OJF2_38170 [Aquisphaera giovannonii]|uniref:Uncharacterized protein n=1 Tax=Aquisphaera giovannonii TaxID=406548 RepID=A0A5B9W500_9BACT|nr:hypothetical protein [Aquisphaera giovannonii]QEH35269.1 hypothetical protein OJF2_38170 [Aquisphaera giovannonii]
MFAGVLGVAATLAGRMRRRAPNGIAWETVLALALPAIALVVTVVGAFAGAWPGGRLAARFAPLGVGDLPARLVNGAWIVAGGFLGYMVGGGIGMAIAIAFFTPQTLGPIPGVLAGLSFARRRASPPPHR